MTAAAVQAGGKPPAGFQGPFSPVRMMEAELAGPLPAVAGAGQATRAWVLVRLHTEPIAHCIIDVGPDGFSPDELAQTLWPAVRQPVGDRFADAGLPAPDVLSGDGLHADPEAWPFLARRAAVLAEAPFISIVICTLNRAERLAACLRYAEAQEYPRYEIVVVDNAPGGEAVPPPAQPPGGTAVTCRYVREPQPGLSRARNTGTAAALGEIIAFLDDDEEPDRFWLAEIARGFSRSTDIGCVTGMIVPTRIDTPAQDWFERRGGHSQGRGYQPAVFSPEGPQSPLYPLPPFGAGGNMSFRRDVLTRIGGFDVALGAGTSVGGGEDTLALTQALLAGYRIAYEPAALVRHDHYPDLAGLSRQVHGYGVGLTAYYAALLRHRPRTLLTLLTLLPMAARYLRRRPETAQQQGSDEVSRSIQRLHRRGMMAGPYAYAKSVRMQARFSRMNARGRAGP